jgi:exportin-T
MAEDAEALARLAYAVQCAYDPRAIGASGAEGHTLQAQATAFCDGVRSSPDGWRLALALFRSPEVNSHAKFFALSLLQSRLGAGEGAALHPAARLEVRVGLLQWIGDGLAAQEPFIRTKLAVVLALCVKCDYPEVWPTAFAELLALVRHGSANTVRCWLGHLQLVKSNEVAVEYLPKRQTLGRII